MACKRPGVQIPSAPPDETPAPAGVSSLWGTGIAATERRHGAAQGALSVFDASSGDGRGIRRAEAAEAGPWAANPLLTLGVGSKAVRHDDGTSSWKRWGSAGGPGTCRGSACPFAGFLSSRAAVLRGPARPAGVCPREVVGGFSSRVSTRGDTAAGGRHLTTGPSSIPRRAPVCSIGAASAPEARSRRPEQGGCSATSAPLAAPVSAARGAASSPSRHPRRAGLRGRSR